MTRPRFHVIGLQRDIKVIQRIGGVFSLRKCYKCAFDYYIVHTSIIFDVYLYTSLRPFLLLATT
jgi:hypothetical protein